MTIFDDIFPLGIGTNRFLIKDKQDEEGLENAALLVANALNAGASYIDVAASYSRGFAAEVCRRAFKKTSAVKHVTVKSSFLADKDSDAALRRVENVFESLDIDHASYYVCWNIASWDQFLQITKKGGLYEGALKAKKQGLVDHLCFSTHASPSDVIKMLETDLFEGVTISFSALNSQIIQPVLDCAEKHQVGVVVMNPLGGGLIPQQAEYFSFLKHPQDTSTIQAALRYVYAHPAVKIALSGMSNQEQLEENLSAFQGEQPEEPHERITRVNTHFSNIEGFCTGCRYCDGCPRGINVFELMQAYNTSLFPKATVMYGRTDPEVLEQIGITSRLKNTFAFLPENSKNPCIACGHCERHCTAHLPIIQRIEKMYQAFHRSCFSHEDMLERLRKLIGNSRKVGFYPGGGYTAYVVSLLAEAFPEETFDISLFDSNSNIWGNVVCGTTVQGPQEILNVKPEMIIVSNYNYGKEIFDSLKHLEKDGIHIKPLHEEFDVPWVF